MTETDEDVERQLRMEPMAINIEKMRRDMTWESRKFVVQVVLALAAAVGAGVAIGTFLLPRSAPTSPPTIIINNLPQPMAPSAELPPTNPSSTKP